MPNPTSANVQAQLKEIQDTASAIGQQVRVLNARSEQDIHGIFRTLSQLRAGGLQLATLAAHYAIPVIYDRIFLSTLSILLVSLPSISAIGLVSGR